MSAAFVTIPGGAVEHCDVLVVGAGPAGCAAAIAAARGGADVLLLERKAMPRPKVCGCCLSPAALGVLADLGVDAPALGVPLHEARVAGWGRSWRLSLDREVAAERGALDLAMARRAAALGVRVMDRAAVGRLERGGTEGGDLAHARVEGAAGRFTVRARMVVAADGLGGTLLSRGRLRRSRLIGAGALIADPPAAYGAGTVWLAVGHDGYVGAVRLADGRLNVAASLRRRCAADLAAAVDRLWRDAGMPPLPAVRWRGTPALRARRRRLWAHRLVVAGDAAGFWEPFTGEGIAWALEAGERAGTVALRLAEAWSPAAARSWGRDQRRWLARRQRGSRGVGMLAASPRLGRLALGVLAARPALARWIVPGRAGLVRGRA